MSRESKARMNCEKEKCKVEGELKLNQESGGPGEQATATSRKAEEVSHLLWTQDSGRPYIEGEFSHGVYPCDPRARYLKTCREDKKDNKPRS